MKTLIILIIALLIPSAAFTQGIVETIIVPTISNNRDFFGRSTDIDGDMAIVGAPGLTTATAHLFQRTAGTWSVVESFPRSSPDGDFGFSAAIDGERFIVGAPRGDSDVSGSMQETGTAHIFERQADGTYQEIIITADDRAINDQFGVSVAIDGDRVIVGASDDDDSQIGSGSAYIFERQSDGSWIQVQKLTAGNPSVNAFYGGAVGLSGDRAIVGADFAIDSNGNQIGTAYIYERQSDGSWDETIITAAGTPSFINFGTGVDIDGDRAVVGARDGRNASDVESGSLYIYDRQSAGIWNETIINASDGANNDDFGISVALEGDMIIVGAHFDGDTNSGSAYLYQRDPDGSYDETKITASIAAANAQFGISVGISGSRVISGAWGGNTSVFGQAYIYEFQDAGFGMCFMDEVCGDNVDNNGNGQIDEACI